MVISALVVVAVFCDSRLSKADTIAVFFALDADLAALKGSESVGTRVVSVGSTTIQGFNVGSHKVWAVKMGAGNVETAVNSIALLSKFPSDLAISIGPAGALGDRLKSGEWYRVHRVIGYQRGTFGLNGWQIAESAERNLSADAIGSSEFLKEWHVLGDVSLASGDAFIAQDAENARIHEITGADAVDMNAFGLVTACTSMKTPLIMWKIISDRANSHANDDFRKFVSAYDGAGGRHVRKLLLRLGSSPNSPDAYENIRKFLR